LSAKDFMGRVLDDETIEDNFFIAISGATYYEFLDQLEHIRHCLKIQVPKIINSHKDSLFTEDVILSQIKCLTTY